MPKKHSPQTPHPIGDVERSGCHLGYLEGFASHIVVKGKIHSRSMQPTQPTPLVFFFVESYLVDYISWIERNKNLHQLICVGHDFVFFSIREGNIIFNCSKNLWATYIFLAFCFQKGSRTILKEFFYRFILKRSLLRRLPLYRNQFCRSHSQTLSMTSLVVSSTSR